LQRVKLLGFIGTSGVGKTPAAEYLVEQFSKQYPTDVIPITTSLKHICMSVFNLKAVDFFTAEGKAASTVLPCKLCPECGTYDVSIVAPNMGLCHNSRCGMIGDSNIFNAHWTSRMVLEHMGDAIRRIDPVALIRNAVDSVKELQPIGIIIFPDLRYKNEMQYLQSKGGQVWLIQKTDNPTTIGGFKNHPSTKEPLDITPKECQEVIVNDGNRNRFLAQLTQAFTRFVSHESIENATEIDSTVRIG